MIGEVARLFVTLGMKDADFKKGLDDLQTGLEKASKNLRAIGAAFTAVGAAGLVMVQSSKKMNAELGMTGITLGISTKEMRELALATTDVTFPLNSVAKTFEILARAGMRSTKEMQATAKAFDNLADTTGSSAEVVADILVPAFKVFGIDLADAGNQVDKFTWLIKNTTIDLAEFGSVMQYVAMYGADLGVTLDDMIAIMAALEARGITGSAATRLFRTAVRQAKDGAVTLNEVLGVTQEQIDIYKTKLDGATGITKKYADMAATQFTIMDKLKQKWSELTLKASGFLEPLEPILAGMTALGPLMIFLSTATGISAAKLVIHTAALVAHKIATLAVTLATKVATAAQWLFNAAIAANPIGLIAIAISGAIAALIFFARRIKDTASESTKEFKKLANDAKMAFESIALSGKTMTEDLRRDVVGAIDPMFDDIISKLESRKGDFLAAIAGMYGDVSTEIETDVATLVARTLGLYYTQEEFVKTGQARIQEIYKTASEEHRATSDEENAEVLQILRTASAETMSIITKGALTQQEILDKLAIAGVRINASMYAAMLMQSKAATQDTIAEVNSKYEKLAEMAQENVGILTGYTREMADEDIAIFKRKRDEVIGIAKDENVKIKKLLDERAGFWAEFWGKIEALFKKRKLWGELGLLSPAELPEIPAASPVPMQAGGIVTKPTLALLGERGSEAIIPLDKGVPSFVKEIHIHIGNFMGDELSLRAFTRKLQDTMREEDRRNMFGGSINLGYGFGRSSI